jgi:hypothetical protein
MRALPSTAAAGAAACSAGYLLLRFASVPVDLVRHLRAPQGWVVRVGTDVAAASVAGTLLWLCALWVVICLAAVWCGRLPGLAGRIGRATARHVVPAAIQRLVAASAGVSLLLGPLPAEAAGHPGGNLVPTGVATGVSTAPSWPVDQPTPGGQQREAGRPIDQPSSSQPSPSRPTPSQPPPSQPIEQPAPSWPVDPGAGATRTGSGGSATPAGRPTRPTEHTQPTGHIPLAEPTPPHRQPAQPSQPAPAVQPAQPGVTVATGDSLWTIAAAQLGPAATDRQIAVAWPYWYRANRPVIGRDPDLLQPGTRLSRPELRQPNDRPGSQPIREGS